MFAMLVPTELDALLLYPRRYFAYLGALELIEDEAFFWTHRKHEIPSFRAERIREFCEKIENTEIADKLIDFMDKLDQTKQNIKDFHGLHTQHATRIEVKPEWDATRIALENYYATLRLERTRKEYTAAMKELVNEHRPEIGMGPLE